MATQSHKGVGVEAITYEDMFKKADRWLQDKGARSHHIACINAYCVTLALQNERLAKIYNGADISGPDGIPFVKWIKTFLKVPCDRFAAPDISLQFAERAKERGYTFYLYGGAPDIIVEMKRYLEEKFPHINIVGYKSPPFRPLSKDEDQQVVDEINRLSPDIILVGLGTPKQDYWIDEHLSRIKGSILIASGATFDFFGGRIKMAPEFVRKSGFEWLYRLLSKDFFRLWRRYTILNVIFLWNFLLQVMRIRVRKADVWDRLY
jgi:N-acetylglucosaminyldiphosphoundecaprenol N-acetyl-beta-D-mannosaminyltransferase